MGQDLLLILERITKQNGYKLKVYSCQNLKGIEVKVIMSENKPANLRLYEAFYTRKSTPTLNSRERNVVDSQTFYFSILVFQYFRDHSLALLEVLCLETFHH